MGLNTPSEQPIDLQVGPTEFGMVRIYIRGQDVDLPLDFEAEDAEAIAEELRAAAIAARKVAKR